MQEQEFANWMVRDTALTLTKALAVYVVFLGAYWAFIG
jgi:hypothetical protein